VPSIFNLAITVVGFFATAAGIWMSFGTGPALIVAGLVLFIAGGLGSVGEGRAR